MGLLKVEKIKKKFNSFYALSDVSFDIKEGEVHSLVGENGAGKSTLIKIISGIYTKTEGKIYWKGKEVEINSPADSQKLGIGTVHQSFPLVTDLSVMENVLLGNLPSKGKGIVDWEEAKRISKDILGRYNLSMDIMSPVKDLSAAQRQLVSIVKTLSLDAKLIILDEPTSTLSQVEKEQLFSLLHDLKSKGVAILYISHDLDDVMAFSDRITILRDGKSVDTMEHNEIEYRRIIKGMVGRDLQATDPVDRNIEDKVILELKNISSDEGIFGINLKLRKSEILGIGGLVGSGRTEILNTIYGNSDYEGEIYLDGQKVDIKNINDALDKGIGFLTEDRLSSGMLTDLSIAKNITINNISQISNNKILDLKKEKELADKYMKLLNVKARNREQSVNDLSGGNQQKVMFARWYMNNPNILLLDEPTSGVDIGSKEEIYQIIYEMTRKGISVILVSSDLPELLRLSDRIIIMKDKTISGYMNNKEDFNQETYIEIATMSDKLQDRIEEAN